MRAAARGSSTILVLASPAFAQDLTGTWRSRGSVTVGADGTLTGSIGTIGIQGNVLPGDDAFSSLRRRHAGPCHDDAEDRDASVPSGP